MEIVTHTHSRKAIKNILGDCYNCLRPVCTGCGHYDTEHQSAVCQRCAYLHREWRKAVAEKRACKSGFLPEQHTLGEYMEE